MPAVITKLSSNSYQDVSSDPRYHNESEECMDIQEEDEQVEERTRLVDIRFGDKESSRRKNTSNDSIRRTSSLGAIGKGAWDERSTANPNDSLNDSFTSTSSYNSTSESTPREGNSRRRQHRSRSVSFAPRPAHGQNRQNKQSNSSNSFGNDDGPPPPRSHKPAFSYSNAYANSPSYGSYNSGPKSLGAGGQYNSSVSSHASYDVSSAGSNRLSTKDDLALVSFNSSNDRLLTPPHGGLYPPRNRYTVKLPPLSKRLY